MYTIPVLNNHEVSYQKTCRLKTEFADLARNGSQFAACNLYVVSVKVSNGAPKFSPVYGYTYRRPLLHLITKLDATQF
jgi:hypothetical protein